MPISDPNTVKYLYSHLLSPFEKEEIAEYKQIYFFGPKAAKISGPEETGSQNTSHRSSIATEYPNHGFDDKRGDYRIILNDHIEYRYEILESLGRGSFGCVVKVFDHKENAKNAIKIIRNRKRFHTQGKMEVQLLKRIHGQNGIYEMKRYFYWRGHLCIVFELLSLNLYEFIKVNEFRGFSLGLVKRAPEVILGLPYSLGIDMWSLGCILCELYTGQPIFPAKNEGHLLALIASIIGPPPSQLYDKATKRDQYFDKRSKLKSQLQLPSQSLKEVLGRPPSLFVEFIKEFLEWDPNKRITPSIALKHSWILDRNRTSLDLQLTAITNPKPANVVMPEIVIQMPENHVSTMTSPKKLKRKDSQKLKLPQIKGSNRPKAIYL